MNISAIITLLTSLLLISDAKAGLFEEVNPPDQDIKDLTKILDLAEIVETGDINDDGADDYIIRYKDSASNYGEFLFNVIISNGDNYRRGFAYDEYFINLTFEGKFLIGTNREETVSHSTKKYIYNAQEKSIKEMDSSNNVKREDLDQ